MAAARRYNGQRFFDLIHQIQPATLVNNRIGVAADFATPEQFIPDRIPTKSNAKNLHELMKSHSSRPSRSACSR